MIINAIISHVAVIAFLALYAILTVFALCLVIKKFVSVPLDSADLVHAAYWVLFVPWKIFYT
jgi:hypothetical protein